MARSFHRKRQLEALSELNVTALIDLGFALLIIFMIATPLIEREASLNLDLPVASQANVEDPPQKVEIAVLPGGFLVDGERMGQAALEEALVRYARQSSPPVVSVRADAETPYQNVVRVLDLMKKHHLKRLSLLTRSEEE